jgi:hypothetical protein
MWTPYEVIRNHPQDFDVQYRFYSQNEGGRKTLPTQGYRCDFSYDGDDINNVGIFCIHPEFEDEKGNIITDINMEVSPHGTARMWILFPEMRQQVHRDRIKVGIKGYFMEGSRKVGEAEVIRIVGLYSNE